MSLHTGVDLMPGGVNLYQHNTFKLDEGTQWSEVGSQLDFPPLNDLLKGADTGNSGFQLPSEDEQLFGHFPLNEDIKLTSCPHCGRAVRQSAYLQHLDICSPGLNGDLKRRAGGDSRPSKRVKPNNMSNGLHSNAVSPTSTPNPLISIDLGFDDPVNLPSSLLFPSQDVPGFAEDAKQVEPEILTPRPGPGGLRPGSNEFYYFKRKKRQLRNIFMSKTPVPEDCIPKNADLDCVSFAPDETTSSHQFPLKNLVTYYSQPVQPPQQTTTASAASTISSTSITNTRNSITNQNSSLLPNQHLTNTQSSTSISPLQASSRHAMRSQIQNQAVPGPNRQMSHLHNSQLRPQLAQQRSQIQNRIPQNSPHNTLQQPQLTRQRNVQMQSAAAQLQQQQQQQRQQQQQAHRTSRQQLAASHPQLSQNSLAIASQHSAANSMSRSFGSPEVQKSLQKNNILVPTDRTTDGMRAIRPRPTAGKLKRAMSKVRSPTQIQGLNKKLSQIPSVVRYPSSTSSQFPPNTLTTAPSTTSPSASLRRTARGHIPKPMLQDLTSYASPRANGLNMSATSSAVGLSNAYSNIMSNNQPYSRMLASPHHTGSHLNHQAMVRASQLQAMRTRPPTSHPSGPIRNPVDLTGSQQRVRQPLANGGLLRSQRLLPMPSGMVSSPRKATPPYPHPHAHGHHTQHHPHGHHTLGAQTPLYNTDISKLAKSQQMNLNLKRRQLQQQHQQQRTRRSQLPNQFGLPQTMLATQPLQHTQTSLTNPDVLQNLQQQQHLLQHPQTLPDHSQTTASQMSSQAAMRNLGHMKNH